ncbi:MAG: fasciclin domain-containing protein [Odoribacter sp.]|nr:fasciclin domain-containing protein [Odoribacter sp.]
MAKINSLIRIILVLSAGIAMASCTKWNYHDGGTAYGVHDCSMWDYFAKQPRDWDSTRLMIQRAGLQELFEGKGEYGQITFLAPGNLAIMTYLYDNGYRRVNEIPAAECRRLLEKLIIPGRIMVNDVPRGSRSTATGEQTGGKTYTLLDESTAFLWTYQNSYMGIENAGAVHLYLYIREFTESWMIYSSDIQTENGVVQALGNNFLFN